MKFYLTPRKETCTISMEKMALKRGPASLKASEIFSTFLEAWEAAEAVVLREDRSSL